MRFYARKRRSPMINIVSLLDIVVILLIFFIATTTFKKAQPQLEINLPESKTAAATAAPKDQPIVLAVKSGDAITLDDKPVTLDALEAALLAAIKAEPARPIAMQADREAPFGVVVKVLDALKGAGVKDVPAFTADPRAAASQP